MFLVFLGCFVLLVVVVWLVGGLGGERILVICCVWKVGLVCWLGLIESFVIVVCIVDFGSMWGCVLWLYCGLYYFFRV